MSALALIGMSALGFCAGSVVTTACLRWARRGRPRALPGLHWAELRADDDPEEWAARALASSGRWGPR